MTIEQLMAAVRAHAIANYEQHGWDILIECWSDNDVAAAIGSARTEARAIANCKRSLRAINEHRAEIVATGEW